MFEIKYNFSTDDNAEEVYSDEKSAHLILSPGNLLFQNEHDSFVLNGNGIPVIDFAFRMLQASNLLFQKNREERNLNLLTQMRKLLLRKTGIR